MVEYIKSVGGFIIGIAGFFLIIFLAVFFIKGGLWLGEIVMPWLAFMMWLVFVIDILIVLPLGILIKLKVYRVLGL